MGKNDTTILFDVKRVRDGKSFCTRVVQAMQENRLIKYFIHSKLVSSGERRYRDRERRVPPASHRTGCQPRLCTLMCALKHADVIIYFKK